MQQSEILIIGAGPAGLTAAYLLTKNNKPVLVLESDERYVGGIAKTVQYQGYYFDIGGHRFFSKATEVEDLWNEILPQDFLTCARKSRIFYQGKFYDYPLRLSNVLRNLGLVESVRCFLSFLKVKCKPAKKVETFAQWVTQQFGSRLFRIFFKTYTEKVWGLSCDEISADWAAQRIKGLSFYSALKNAIKVRPGSGEPLIKTLIDSFRYPRLGPGMLWEACAQKIRDQGGHINLGCTVIGCRYELDQWIISYVQDGVVKQHQARYLISSAPLRNLVTEYLNPKLSAEVVRAAENLRYRDFLIVVLILQDRHSLTDNWLYIHDDQVTVARIQNFKAWSKALVPEAEMCCYGMEYFCFENDGLWTSADDVLIKKATQELVHLGLAAEQDIREGYVVRQSKAYPVYDEHYQNHVRIIRENLKKTYPSLFLIGRNGMHKYNNQDHAMMTAMLTVKNILAGTEVYDVWCVNEDAEYHEEITPGTNARLQPQKVKSLQN